MQMSLQLYNWMGTNAQNVIYTQFTCLLLHMFIIMKQVTCMILGVLRFGPPYFIFNDGGSLEWPQDARISDVWLDSTLEAFDNQSLVITGQTSQQVYITTMII